jgi:hypothetical protein
MGRMAWMISNKVRRRLSISARVARARFIGLVR